MNRISSDKRAQVVRCLIEGCSIRSTTRLTGVSKGTVLRLLELVGDHCAHLHDVLVRNVRPEPVQVDELWAFCHTRQQNLDEPEAGKGDVWTWIAFGADSKMMLCWHLGERSHDEARAVLLDLSERINGRFLLSTDGFREYVSAVRAVFGESIDYGQCIKSLATKGKPHTRSWTSQAEVVGVKKRARAGNPDLRKVETAYIERNNLGVRMGMRRYTRLSNGFSKKFLNMAYAFSLHAFHHNFIRMHSALGTVPAVAAGIIDEPWTFDRLMESLEEAERRAN